MRRRGSIKLAVIVSIAVVLVAGLLFFFWKTQSDEPKQSGRFDLQPIAVAADPWSLVGRPTRDGDGAADIATAMKSFAMQDKKIEQERYTSRAKAGVPDLYNQIRRLYRTPAITGQPVPWGCAAEVLASAEKRDFNFQSLGPPDMEWREPMDFRRKLEAIADMAVIEGRLARERNRFEEAERIFKAVLVYGVRLAENKVRVSYQLEGLSAQSSAAEQLARLYLAQNKPAEAKAAEQYMKAAQSAFEKTRGVFLPLFQHINKWDPGDLIMFARRHPDPAWRAEAVLALGMCQHNPSVKTHHEAVLRCIKDLAKDSEGAVVQAARWASNLKREDYRTQTGMEKAPD